MPSFMPAKPLLALPLLALLVACGTPQEQCISAGTRDLRVLDRLIGQTEGNLQRGYALVDVVETRTRWVVCAPGVAATATSPAQPPQMCLDDIDYTVTQPQAINLADERVKLAEMKKKRAQLARAATGVIAQCKAIHPE